MKIVVLDGYALNPGDLSWEALESLGDVEIRDILTSTATDLGAPGWDTEYGFGLINAEAAVAACLNEAPIADAGGPYSGLVGEDIVFDASASYDTDGSVVDWEWDFIDGTPKEYGAVVSHSYSSPGSHILLVVVTDDAGGTGWSTAMAYVDQIPNLLPTAILDGPWEGTTAVEMVFDEFLNLRFCSRLVQPGEEFQLEHQVIRGAAKLLRRLQAQSPGNFQHMQRRVPHEKALFPGNGKGTGFIDGPGLIRRFHKRNPLPRQIGEEAIVFSFQVCKKAVEVAVPFLLARSDPLRKFRQGLIGRGEESRQRGTKSFFVFRLHGLHQAFL